MRVAWRAGWVPRGGCQRRAKKVVVSDEPEHFTAVVCDHFRARLAPLDAGGSLVWLARR
jgi:hypothetical protein